MTQRPSSILWIVKVAFIVVTVASQFRSRISGPLHAITVPCPSAPQRFLTALKDDATKLAVSPLAGISPTGIRHQLPLVLECDCKVAGPTGLRQGPLVSQLPPVLD